MPSPPAKKQRPPPKPVVVEAVETVTPGVMRVTFTGDDLAGFALAKPGAHMKLLFADGPWPPPGVENPPRPPSRTYTPRRYDVAAARLEVEFVMHGAGIASDWAAKAKAGDPLLVAGPGGGYPIPAGMTRLVIAADDTALPAAATIVEALPANCEVVLLCEIEDAREERPLSPQVATAPHWLHRAPTRAKPGALLEAAVAALPPQPPETCYWVACEAGTMRRIRDMLSVERKVPRAQLHTRGYWKYGDQNYPDHDYGED